MTLNRIAQDIADALNRPFDTMLIERLKGLILEQRSLLIRQSIDKNGVDRQYVQNYIVDLEEVDIADGTTLAGMLALRSSNKIATTIRTKTAIPFLYVGAIDGTNSFVYRTRSELKYLQSVVLLGGSSYDYYNGYV